MWHRCVRRSRTAPVSRSLPRTSVHCSNGRFVVTITLVRSYAVLITSNNSSAPSLLAGITPVMWALIALLFVSLGVFLLRKKAWARMSVIFLQGFNIIVRLLVLIGNVASGGRGEAPATVDYWMLGTFVVSMALSATIFYYVDQPDIRMLAAQA